MKILIVLPRFPYPLEKGDKLRAYHQIKSLSKNNDIYLFCVSHQRVLEQHIEQLRPYCREIKIVKPAKLVSYKNVIRNFMLAKSLQIGYWDSKKARKAYKSFEKAVQPDVVYSQMVRTMTLVSHSSVPKVMDFQDALSMNLERRMDLTKAGWWHWVLHYEFKMLRSSEYNSFKIFDDLVIISETDSEAIPHKKNGEINIVPNGVDFDYYQPRKCEQKYDFVFCGNMQYAPNVNASKYLVEKVMPIVWEKFPEAKVLLAGASPKAAVRQLASDRVSVSGWVEDIRECYAEAKIFVAPMQMGSGLQNKLLEAMAMQRPCVTTTLANNSLNATPDKEVLIGDTEQEFAQHLIDLLQDEQRRNTLAMAGYEFVKEHYSWDTYGKKLEDILKKASLRRK